MKNVFSTERKIIVGFGTAVLLLCAIAGISIWLTLALLGELKAVSDRNGTLQDVREFRLSMGQMATAGRLYGLERSAKNFGEWDKLQQDTMSHLGDLIDESAEQRTDFEAINVELRRKIERTLAIEGVSADSNAAELQTLWNADSFTDIRNLLVKIDTAEQGALEQRNNRATGQAQAALWTIGSAGLLAVFLVTGAVALILRDLRARRMVMEELERARLAAESASMAKSSFLAHMSHELRTPLTAIMGYADLLLSPGPVQENRAGSDEGPRPRQEYLQTMRRSGEHLLTLISDILDVSKIEAGRMTVEQVDCRLVDILADINSLMSARASEKAISFAVDYATAMPERIVTDPTRLRQILMNLVGNAIKFTDHGGVRLVVYYDPPTPASRRISAPMAKGGRTDGSGNGHATAPGIVQDIAGHLRLKVVDTGVGISEEQRKSLFQPFIQADLSTTRRFGGTGLGLSISTRLAELLGGVIVVQSEMEKGSTFQLTVPVHAGGAMLLPEQARQAVAGAGRTMDYRPRQLSVRILLVEDGEESREVITLHLMHAGCHVTTAPDGEIACRLALASIREREPQTKPFDVILMDMQMPVMDGYTATARLRSEGYQGPIVALTAHAMKEDRDRCLRVGCDEYAAKPVDIPGLLNLIERLSGRGGTATVSDRLRENPVLRELTRKFCLGTKGTVEDLTRQAAELSRIDFGAAAHRFAGAAGAYGFNDISQKAKELEQLARADASEEALREQLARLDALCAHARGELAATEQKSG